MRAVRDAIRRVLAVLHRWAESGWTGAAVGSWAVLQGSVVPGMSETLLIPLGLADPRRALYLAAWATAGSTVGGFVAYAIGAHAVAQGGAALLDWIGVGAQSLDSYRPMFERHGWKLVLLSTLSPVPTKLICIGAGTFGVPFWQFAVALFVGRGARFLAVGLLLRFAGERVAAWFARGASSEARTSG
jgi:membrane protein YqaA with SNARE-associated domain